MAAEAIRVLVLYRHPLLGLGLAEMLAREASLEVTAVDEGDRSALDAALAGIVDVIVFEEGGAIEALDLLRRTPCPLLIDVSIGSSRAWAIRRDTIRSAPERLFDVIRDACLEQPGVDARLPTSDARLPTSDALLPRDAPPPGAEVPGPTTRARPAAPLAH